MKNPFLWIANKLILDDLLHFVAGHLVAIVSMVLVFAITKAIFPTLFVGTAAAITIGIIKEQLIDERIYGNNASTRDAVATVIGGIYAVAYTWYLYWVFS